MNEKLNQFIYESVSLIKIIIEEIYSESDIEMRFSQLGLEPLSVINKDEKEIVEELENNIVKMLSHVSKLKQTEIKKYSNFFCDNDNDKLIEVSKRITSLMPLVNYSKENSTFSRIEFVEQANEYVKNTLDTLCSILLCSYMMDCMFLYDDYKNYKELLTESEESITSIGSSSTISRYFDIISKNGECYQNMADAINANEEAKKLKQEL